MMRMENERKTTDNYQLIECDLFKGGMPEGVESSYNWNKCTKNPGHKLFYSAQDFKDNHLPKIQSVRSREVLRCKIELTVRLSVHCTSHNRRDDDAFSQLRGSPTCRKGTGFIDLVYSCPSNAPCPPCAECDGKIKKKHWIVRVLTARHVVFNAEEAKHTKVDLFLDDESCERDGTMRTLLGLETEGVFDIERDWSHMSCLTCDEDLVERIKIALSCYNARIADLDLSGLDYMPSCERNRDHALIISHPHGQAKKITVGELMEFDYPLMLYTVPTCPGSSGAPVFMLKYHRDTGKFGCLDGFSIFPNVHSGSCSENTAGHEDQLNFGYF